MKILVRKRFITDAAKIKSGELIDQLLFLLEEAASAEKADNVAGFKWLKGTKIFGRIKLNSFRIGVSVNNNVLTFICLLQRSEVYKQFPK